MGNIDDNAISSILAKIDSIRKELEALEYEVKAFSASEPVTVPEEVPEEVPEDVPVDVLDDVPQEPIDLSIADIDIPAENIPSQEDIPEEDMPEEVKPPILDSAKADTAVMDVLAERQAWRIDRPGSAVKNVISAISLNDRVLLINVLFGEDPMLFQETISAFNNMQDLEEAVSYIKANFPDWDLDSEPVYRLMMAVRRKLR